MQSKTDARLLLTILAALFLCALVPFTLLSTFSAAAAADVWLLWLSFLCLLAGGLCTAWAGNIFGRGHFFCLFALALGGGLLARILLLNALSADYTDFLQNWVWQMRALNGTEALRTQIGNYNMPYMYILFFISRLGSFQDLYLIKLFSIVFDLAAAFAVVYLLRLFCRRASVLLAAFCGVLFLPTFLLNSAWWAQCDSVYAALCLWSLYCGLRGKGWACMALFGAAFAFKLQAVFAVPFLLVLLLIQRIPWRSVLGAPAVFGACSIPALLCGRSIKDIFGIYFMQVDYYSTLSQNAPGFWSLFPNEYESSFGYVPLVIAGAAVLGVLFLFLDVLHTMTARQLCALAFILCLLTPFMLPKMHERYFYIAEALSLVYVAGYTRRWYIMAVLQFCIFTRYSQFLFGNAFWWPAIQTDAVVIGVLLGTAIYTLYRECTAAPANVFAAAKK